MMYRGSVYVVPVTVIRTAPGGRVVCVIEGDKMVEGGAVIADPEGSVPVFETSVSVSVPLELVLMVPEPGSVKDEPGPLVPSEEDVTTEGSVVGGRMAGVLSEEPVAVVAVAFVRAGMLGDVVGVDELGSIVVKEWSVAFVKMKEPGVAVVIISVLEEPVRVIVEGEPLEVVRVDKPGLSAVTEETVVFVKRKEPGAVAVVEGAVTIMASEEPVRVVVEVEPLEVVRIDGSGSTAAREELPVATGIPWAVEPWTSAMAHANPDTRMASMAIMNYCSKHNDSNVWLLPGVDEASFNTQCSAVLRILFIHARIAPDSIFAA